MAVLAGCGSQAGITRIGGETMGTTWQAVYRSTAAPVEDESAEVEALLEDINQSLSTYLDDSLISAINRESDPEFWHPVDRHFQTVFDRARFVYADTGGAFDPAVGPLVDAWGFGPDGPEGTPEPRSIESLLGLVSFEAFELRISPPGIRKTIPGAKLDFSAIAKGYGVDALGELIESWGVADYFVEVGGEVRARGQHPEGRPWRVGIERPAGEALDRAEIQSVLTLRDASLATSGTYRNYRIQDGRRIAHILNPATGYPGESPLLSVSVLAEDTMTADAYATAFMVMGLDAALGLVESRDGLEASFIVSGAGGELREVRSSGFPVPRVE
jgi:thiamine biosynthesis lipoprotein